MVIDGFGHGGYVKGRFMKSVAEESRKTRPEILYMSPIEFLLVMGEWLLDEGGWRD